jgi:hypothetical protein
VYVLVTDLVARAVVVVDPHETAVAANTWTIVNVRYSAMGRMYLPVRRYPVERIPGMVEQTIGLQDPVDNRAADPVVRTSCQANVADGGES